MGYTKPTTKAIKSAIENGFSRKDAKRGYDITIGHCGLLEIQRIDACVTDDWDVSDDDCAIEAERSGFCKIIPVNELPKNFKDKEGSLRYFGWIDTPENRKAIQEYCEKAKE